MFSFYCLCPCLVQLAASARLLRFFSFALPFQFFHFSVSGCRRHCFDWSRACPLCRCSLSGANFFFYVRPSGANVDHEYVSLLRKIYRDQKASVQTDEESKIFDIQKGSKQGDPMFSLLFNTVLQYSLKDEIQRWQKKKGIGIYLSDHDQAWRFSCPACPCLRDGSRRRRRTHSRNHKNRTPVGQHGALTLSREDLEEIASQVPAEHVSGEWYHKHTDWFVGQMEKRRKTEEEPEPEQQVPGT